MQCLVFFSNYKGSSRSTGIFMSSSKTKQSSQNNINIWYPLKMFHFLLCNEKYLQIILLFRIVLNSNNLLWLPGCLGISLVIDEKLREKKLLTTKCLYCLKWAESWGYFGEQPYSKYFRRLRKGYFQTNLQEMDKIFRITSDYRKAWSGFELWVSLRLPPSAKSL